MGARPLRHSCKCRVLARLGSKGSKFQWRNGVPGSSKGKRSIPKGLEGPSRPRGNKFGGRVRVWPAPATTRAWTLGDPLPRPVRSEAWPGVPRELQAGRALSGAHLRCAGAVRHPGVWTVRLPWRGEAAAGSARRYSDRRRWRHGVRRPCCRRLPAAPLPPRLLCAPTEIPAASLPPAAAASLACAQAQAPAQPHPAPPGHASVGDHALLSSPGREGTSRQRGDLDKEKIPGRETRDGPAWCAPNSDSSEEKADGGIAENVAPLGLYPKRLPSPPHAEDKVETTRGRLDGRVGIQHSSSPFPPVPCPPISPTAACTGEVP